MGTLDGAAFPAARGALFETATVLTLALAPFSDGGDGVESMNGSK